MNNLIQQVKQQILDSDSSDVPVQKPVVPKQIQKTKKSKKSPLEVDTVWDISQTLLSCLYAWGLDKNIDSNVKEKLDILSPKNPLCFGVLSRKHFMSLSLPHVDSTGVS